MRPLHYEPCPIGLHVLGNLAAYVEFDALAVGLDLASHDDLPEWHPLIRTAFGGEWPTYNRKPEPTLAEARFMLREKTRVTMEGMASGVCLGLAGGKGYDRAAGETESSEQADKFALWSGELLASVKRALPLGATYRPCIAAGHCLDYLLEYIETDRLMAGLESLPAVGVGDHRSSTRALCSRRLIALRAPRPQWAGFAGGWPEEPEPGSGRETDIAEFAEKIATLRATVIAPLPLEVPAE